MYNRRMERFAVDEKYIWLFDLYSCAIFSVDILTGEAYFCGFAGDKKWNQFYSFQDMISWDNKLFLIPNSFHSIQVFDTKRRKIISEIPYTENRDEHYISSLKFLTSVRVEKEAFVIPYNQSFILGIDFETNQLEYIDNYRDDIEEIRREEDNIGTGIFSNAKAIMDKLYIPLRFTNRLMIYDAVTREYEILRIGQNKYCYTDVCYDGSQLWLTTIDGDVFVWDRGSERTEKVFSYSQSRLTSNIRDGRSPYPYIFSDSEFIFVFDYVYPVIKINKNSGIASIAEEMGEAARYSHVCAREHAGKIYSHCPSQNKIVIFDSTTREFRILTIKHAPDIGREMLESFIDTIKNR